MKTIDCIWETSFRFVIEGIIYDKSKWHNSVGDILLEKPGIFSISEGYFWKEGRNGVFTSLSTARVISERDRNLELGINSPSPSQIIPRGLSVAEGPKKSLHSAAHLYSDKTNLLGGPAEIQNLQTHPWETGIVTTRPRRILLILPVTKFLKNLGYFL